MKGDEPCSPDAPCSVCLRDGLSAHEWPEVEPEPVFEPDVEADVVEMLPGTRYVPTLHEGKARQMALAKAARDRARQKEREERTRKRVKKAVLDNGEAAEDIANAAESRVLIGKTIEELAELILKRQAHIILLGGEAMLPTSPKEVTEIASGWAGIAYKYASIRKGLPASVTEDDEDDPVKRAAAMLRTAQKRARDAAKATG